MKKESGTLQTARSVSYTHLDVYKRQISTFTAGEMSVTKSAGADTAANGLRTQAELIMAPYTGDHFSFMGVKG